MPAVKSTGNIRISHMLVPLAPCIEAMPSSAISGRGLMSAFIRHLEGHGLERRGTQR